MAEFFPTARVLAFDGDIVRPGIDAEPKGEVDLYQLHM